MNFQMLLMTKQTVLKTVRSIVKFSCGVGKQEGANNRQPTPQTDNQRTKIKGLGNDARYAFGKAY